MLNQNTTHSILNKTNSFSFMDYKNFRYSKWYNK